ncbi:hypothetical protein [Bacillus multifaciens]|uniref:hypothetical protein n=1 Tax=Bacillus multifaciens TaxID=3068506 RepID=UPI002741C8DA|nr:hypothetical protein [Bacillus sp. WLY-B-L8]MDP7978539.1 hypothetical protein [Bacillus sp. WLY-B-L8]
MLKIIIGTLGGLWLLYGCIKEKCWISAGIAALLVILSVVSLFTEFLNELSFMYQLIIAVTLSLGGIVAYTYESERKERR